MARLLLLNGPNLNLLGTREPGLYGADTLDAIVQRCAALARDLGHELTARQSNAEHELVNEVQGAPRQGVEFMILNPGAFTHSSISHVGLYAGNGTILHASRPGKPVQYIKMAYMPYAGARRPG